MGRERLRKRLSMGEKVEVGFQLGGKNERRRGFRL